MAAFDKVSIKVLIFYIKRKLDKKWVLPATLLILSVSALLGLVTEVDLNDLLSAM